MTMNGKKLSEKPEECPECGRPLDQYMECPNGCGHWEKNVSFWVWEQSENDDEEDIE